ncbi:MAG: hypothetical protein KDA05_08595 [Phycisphaerales bacterium]|nr:hypothetical protein [Phycisphaerales bacterium]
MLPDPLWAQVRCAMTNFPVLMQGVMMLAAAKAAAGENPGVTLPDPGPQVRAMVAQRLGRAPLDQPVLDRIREHMSEADARAMVAACEALHPDLPPITTELAPDEMLAHTARPGPGDDAFDAFMAAFMPIAERIQQIVQPTN